MAININLEQLEQEDMQFDGKLPAAELDLQLGGDILVHSADTLNYQLDATYAGDTLLVRGSLNIDFACDCARCLEPFTFILELPEWTCVLPLKGPDAVEPKGEYLDLTQWVREDILLGLPQHPQCGAQCRGLVSQAKAEETDPD
jgi:uncharacterized metal-binding protein YceD (DUF177 family)